MSIKFPSEQLYTIIEAKMRQNLYTKFRSKLLLRIVIWQIPSKDGNKRRK